MKIPPLSTMANNIPPGLLAIAVVIMIVLLILVLPKILDEDLEW